MRLAFVDLVFSWPPNGGADVDLFHTLVELQAAGHEVHLFVSAYHKGWERGVFDPAALPFAATRLEFNAKTLTGPNLAARFREAVDRWNPAVVFICDGFFLKPWVIEALSHYPTAGRLYAYEHACMRDSLLFKDGQPCPCNYLHTPDTCRPCALKGMGWGIKRWQFLAWTHEYLAARAFMPGYHARLVKALGMFDVIIVSNPLMAEQLAGINDRVRILPGGVDVGEFAHYELEFRGPGAKKIVFMAGRVEDPMKGLETLRNAGEKLAGERSDFVIQATHTDRSLNNEWFESIGWKDRKSLQEHYRSAQVCVVPSLWEEPFGLVAVEAMASGRPVCASQVGGLQHIVVHGETGLLFERGNSAALAECLAALLDDDGRCQRMGRAGRKRAEELYDWKRVVAAHYPPLLEELGP